MLESVGQHRGHMGSRRRLWTDHRLLCNLVVPLYNWYVHSMHRLPRERHHSCQVPDQNHHPGPVFVGKHETPRQGDDDFIVNPKGPLDLYDTLRSASGGAQARNRHQMRLDGITPAFGIAFDAVRPIMLANIVNETVNALVAAADRRAPSPRGKRFQTEGESSTLKRAAVYAGKCLDEVVDAYSRACCSNRQRQSQFFHSRVHVEAYPV